MLGIGGLIVLAVDKILQIFKIKWILVVFLENGMIIKSYTYIFYE